MELRGVSERATRRREELLVVLRQRLLQQLLVGRQLLQLPPQPQLAATTSRDAGVCAGPAQRHIWAGDVHR